MARRFSVQRGATRVVFGAGASAEVGPLLDELGTERVLVVCTPGRKGEVARWAAELGARGVGVVALAREHVPVDAVTAAARELEKSGADTIVAWGGGSAIGLAKALARTAHVRIAAIPTSYSGSEMTSVYGVTENGEKKTGRDERVRPTLVVYDPTLTAGLPRDVALPSLWNAMAHAVEALWVDGADRAARLAAEEALRLLARSAPRLAHGVEGDAAREDALDGAYLAGAVFADAGGGLHHKVCHILGGSFGLPHARTHAALLPHVVRLHRDAAPDAMAAIGRALGVLDPVEGIARLARASGVAVGLGALGLKHADLERVAERALALPVAHPKRLERPELVAWLEEAWSGLRPEPPPSRLHRPESLAYRPGFGSTHESEAIAGALPRRQNAPRRGPFGLYPELLNGTPFTVRRDENSRVWMYRVRPSFSHAAFLPLPAGRFSGALGDVDPNRTRWRPLPIPVSPDAVDFLDGLVTLGGAGDPTSGPGYRVHLYAANADMTDRSFADADGDLLILPQTGTLDVRTELGWLRVPVGSFAVVPRAIKFSVGVPQGGARGWMLEVFARRFRLPERGPIGSNGLADARHFQAPSASFEDRLCPAGFSIVNKLGGRLYAAAQEHSPFDVAAWHGVHAPFVYDLALFNAMGSVTFDHPDPSILTVLTAPLDDHGRAVADFVVFPGRWEVIEHSFRPPFMHRNAASEVNMVVRTPSPESGYDPGVTFVSPMLTGHGVSTSTYAHVLSLSDDHVDPPRRLPDESLWAMFESAMPFCATAWARETPLVDREFLRLFEGMRSRFDPSRA